MNEKQINRKPKKSFSIEEKRNYWIAWKKSGINQSEFCKANGISRSAFYQWSQVFKEEGSEVGFSPLVIDKQLSVNSTDIIQLNIAFTHSSLQLNLAIPECRLVSFIQEISHATTIVR